MTLKQEQAATEAAEKAFRNAKAEPRAAFVAKALAQWKARNRPWVEHCERISRQGGLLSSKERARWESTTANPIVT